jgi:hypothetical protein
MYVHGKRREKEKSAGSGDTTIGTSDEWRSSSPESRFLFLAVSLGHQAARFVMFEID